MNEYTLVNFKAVFLELFQIVFRQKTQDTFSLSNNNSSTNSAWQLSLAPLESLIIFHMVHLFHVIFQLISDFNGAGHILHANCILYAIDIFRAFRQYIY